MNTPILSGIHHVTAIAADPQRNLDYYVRFLGLRLVKRTVNFDDPGTYHFYYGDDTGRPGTVLTFFPWVAARRGRHGTGQVTLTSFSVPAGSLGYWTQRAQSFGVEASEAAPRFGTPVLSLTDPDGLSVELIESAAPARETDSADIPADYAINGIGSATLTEDNTEKTIRALVDVLHFRQTEQDGDRQRFEIASGGAGAVVDVVANPGGARGLMGAGAVHHIAFRTPDDETQRLWQQELMSRDFDVSPVMDRQYFHSIYFREPGGVLFEIATDGPGFTVDEPMEELGSALKLPPVYEHMRARIEGSLPEITVPSAGLLTERY